MAVRTGTGAFKAARHAPVLNALFYFVMDESGVDDG
jgi:hypothetical protein